jgi:hypothetical protein
LFSRQANGPICYAYIVNHLVGKSTTLSKPIEVNCQMSYFLFISYIPLKAHYVS